MLSALALTEQITLGADISLLGGSQEQSRRIHDYIAGSEEEDASNKFWGSPLAPRWLLEDDPNKTSSRTKNGGKMTALTASQKSVRGPHPQRLRMDEVDEMKEDLVDSAMGQPMGANGISPNTTFSSTHQYPRGTMTDILDRSDRKDWPVYQWCFKETVEPHGWLSQREVDIKRKDMASTTWKREYKLEKPSPEDTAINAEAVDNMFDPRLGEYEGANGQEVIHRKPNNNTHYHGTDWAKSEDWTSITTFEDVLSRDYILLVAYLRIGRKPWPVMVQKHNRRVDNYGGFSMHDETGVGGVVDDYLEVDSEGFDFRRKKERNEMINRYIGAIEDGRIVSPDIEFVREEHRTASNEMVFGSGHIPDSIVSGALAFNVYHDETTNNLDLVL